MPGISPLVSQCVAPAVSETAWGESKTGEPKPVVVVYGESGTGKSSFVCRVLDGTFCEDRGGAWRRLHRRILARHICSVNDEDSLDPRLWAEALAGQIFLRAAELGQTGEGAGFPFSNHEELVHAMRAQKSARLVLGCVVPVEPREPPFWKLARHVWTTRREALTDPSGWGSDEHHRVAARRRSKDASALVRVVATSRPDEATRVRLTLSGARIDMLAARTAATSAPLSS